MPAGLRGGEVEDTPVTEIAEEAADQGVPEPTQEDIAIEEAVQEAAAENESADDGAAGEEAKGDDAPASGDGEDGKKDQ